MFFWCVFSQAAVLFLAHITFAFLASAVISLFIRTVVVFTITVVLIIFTVCIKGFRRLLRLISIA
jgi:hypothetical protein